MTRTFYTITENGKTVIAEDTPTQSEERKVKIARAKRAKQAGKYRIVNSLPDDTSDSDSDCECDSEDSDCECNGKYWQARVGESFWK